MEKSNNGIPILALVVVFITIGFILYSNRNAPESAVVDGAFVSADQDIIESSSKIDNLSTTVALIDSSDLTATLKSIGPYTVFFPSNSAFDKLPEGTLENLLNPENISELSTILTYHVIPGEHSSSNLADGEELLTVNGQVIKISKVNGNLKVNGAVVETKDIVAKNGVIFVIDTVLMPAPETVELQPQQIDVIENIERTSNLATLISSLNSTQLSTDLESEGPFTILAPTDSAFAKLPAGTLDSLLEPENESYLIRLLQHHIIEEQYDRENLIDGLSLKALSGLDIVVSKSDNSLEVNGALVISEIKAQNGIIYILDKVITPK